jgi:GT2 family glycosyltransferase
MDLSILIISYNTRDLTLACLASVFAQTHRCAFEVIVVDNASSDGSADAIAEKFPQVELIRSAENLGFARANNLGAAEARGDYLLLLNPDTEILDGGIDHAMDFARERAGSRDGKEALSRLVPPPQVSPGVPGAGEWVIGGRTFFADGRLNYSSCHGAPTPWSVVCIALGLSSVFRRSRWLNPEELGGWRRDSVREVGVITGCFCLLKRTLWDQLQGFDESFFMYGEDTDLCLRARRLGARCVICPQATLVHHGGQSEKVRADKMVRLFCAKTQLFAVHWGGARSARFGARMLSVWAWTRMVAFGGLQWVRPGRAESWRTWRQIWLSRGQWMAIGGKKAMPATADASNRAVRTQVRGISVPGREGEAHRDDPACFAAVPAVQKEC